MLLDPKKGFQEIIAENVFQLSCKVRDFFLPLYELASSRQRNLKKTENCLKAKEIFLKKKQKNVSSAQHHHSKENVSQVFSSSTCGQVAEAAVQAMWPPELGADQFESQRVVTINFDNILKYRLQRALWKQDVSDW